jgi:hypothetical protein
VAAIAALLGLAVGGAFASEAAAQPHPTDAGAPADAGAGPTADVMVVAAAQVDGGVVFDKDIEPELKDKLSQGPFRGYNNFKLLDRRPVPLHANQPSTYPIKNGPTVKITLKEKVGPQSYKLLADVSSPGDTRPPTTITFTAGPKRYFLLGPFPAGRFLVITIKK